MDFLPQGETFDQNKSQSEGFDIVGNRFFETMGIPMIPPGFRARCMLVVGLLLIHAICKKGGRTMNHWIWLVSLIGILSTAVVCGTDMFFLTIGRPALRLASTSAGTEIMGFFHMFADARMPIWGFLAILSNFLLLALGRSGQRWFYFASLVMLILFVVIYNRLSKPIDRLQTEAVKTRERLNNGPELRASWDISVMIRVPLLVVSLLAQCLVLLVASA